MFTTIRTLLLATLLCLLSGTESFAQSSADGHRPLIDGGDVLAVAVQADGNALIGGTFTSVDGVARNRIARLNPDGTLDTGFNPGADDAVLAIAVQPSGHIVIGGSFSQVGGQSRPFLAWLNASGSVRNAPAAPSNTVRAIVATGTGIVVGGNFFEVGGNARQGLAAYTTLGTQMLLVSSFPTANNTVASLARDHAGRIVVGGLFTQIGGLPRARLARLTSGVVDSDFNPGANSTVSVLAVQADDSVIVGGAFSELGGLARTRLGRVRADGSVDPQFTPTPDGVLFDAVVLADGRIVLGGEFDEVSGMTRRRVARLHGNGSLDLDFQAPGLTSAAFAAALAVQPDGKLLVGGHFPGVGGRLRNKLLRLYDNGGLDDDYTEGPGSGVVSALAVDGRGRALVGGSFSNYAGNSRPRLARLLADGRLDPAFAPSIGSGSVLAIAALADDSVLLGGSFTSAGSQTRNRIARLTASGELVASYAPSANDLVDTLVVQPPHPGIDGPHPGGVLVAGLFNTISGVPRNQIARLLDDGTVDLDFAPNPQNGVVAASVHAVTLQDNGDILFGGLFNAVAGQTRNNIARLRPTGAIDLGFSPSITNGRVRAIVQLPDGRLLVGGSFLQVNGVSRQRLARLNANGSLDTGFTIAANDTVYAFSLLRDGSVLVAGDFTQLGGLPRNHLARLRPDGSVDPQFNPNSNGRVQSLVLLPDGKLLIGGLFSQVGGRPRPDIARLSMPSALLQSLHLNATTGLVRWDGSAGFPALAGSGPGLVDLALSFDGQAYVSLAGMQADAEGWSATLPLDLLPRELPFLLRARGRHRQIDGSSSVIDSVRQFHLPVTDRIFANGFD